MYTASDTAFDTRSTVNASRVNACGADDAQAEGELPRRPAPVYVHEGARAQVWMSQGLDIAIAVASAVQEYCAAYVRYPPRSVSAGLFPSRARGARRFFQRLHRHEVRPGTMAHPCDAMFC